MVEVNIKNRTRTIEAVEIIIDGHIYRFTGSRAKRINQMLLQQRPAIKKYVEMIKARG